MHLLPDPTLVLQWIIFALVYLVVTRLVFRPILQTLSLRTARTAGLAEEAHKVTERADARLKQYEERIATAHAAALLEKDELIHHAMKEKEALLKEAKRAWDETIQQIRSQISSEIKSAALTIKGEIKELAKSIADKVLA